MKKKQFTKYPIKHPLHPDCPAERVEIIDYYRIGGSAVGLLLEFGDEHRACLTFDEIRALQAETEPNLA